MKTHKRSVNLRETVCGLNITYAAPNFEEPVTDDPQEVNCLDCLEVMGKANSNSKGQTGTYTNLPIQPWHFAETNNLSFLEGCIVKRVCRHRQKDGAQDIDKAIEELKLLKDHLYGH